MLVEQGIISENNYIQALSAHFSMPIVSLKDYTPSAELQKTIGERYAMRHHIVVLSNTPEKLTVAISEPHLSVFDYLEKAMPKGKYISFCLARVREIEHSLDKLYDPYYAVL